MHSFSGQPLAIAQAFANPSALAAIAAAPRVRHGSAVSPAAGSRLVYRELIGVMEPEVNQPLTSQLLRDAADDAVAGVALYMDSPGGTVMSTLELAEAVRRVAARKRIDVVAAGYLTSGAIWVASQATTITCSPSTLVGSIGVLHCLIDDSEMAKQLGVRVVTVSTSNLKTAGLPGVEVSDEHVAMIRRLVDLTFMKFQFEVKRGRGLSDEQLNAIATGDVWYAETARHKKLIDQVALFEDAMAAIVERYPPQKYSGLTGSEAYSQLLSLANHGLDDDDEQQATDLDEISASTMARLTKEFPQLVAEARKFESTRTRPSYSRPRLT